jgi:hypothetical protein
LFIKPSHYSMTAAKHLGAALDGDAGASPDTCHRPRLRVRASLWAISRPLPGKPFPNEWDFCVEASVPEDRDRFIFGDFVVVIAAFVNGLDDCGELFLRSP